MRLIRPAALVVALAALVPLAASAQNGPAWVATHLPSDVLSMVCAPTAAHDVPSVPLRVTGGQSLESRATAAPGELITIIRSIDVVALPHA